MKVMTFNLRFENDRDGDNNWIHRRQMVVDVINRYEPDILGTQEGKWDQLVFLDESLSAYQVVMPGRVPDKKIQCATLFVRKSACRVLAAEDFWLSKTPGVHLSKDWDSAFPRMLSFARLGFEKTGREIVAAVTHLDHMGVEARLQQAKIIAQWAQDQKYPVVLTGDFNDAPHSNPYKVLTSPDTRLCDTWKTMGQEESRKAFTRHGFNGIPQVSRMDWILADCGFRVTDTRVVHDHVDGRYPSDHFPYLAELAFSPP